MEPDLGFGRGIGFYTRMIFELLVETPEGDVEVCGGGRYDGLVEELGGPATPGIGFAAGIERALYALEQGGIEIPGRSARGTLVIGLDEESRRRALLLAESIRGHGLRAETDYFDRGLKAQRKQADCLGARWAVILGEDELKTGRAVVRDLAAAGRTFADLAPEEWRAYAPQLDAGVARAIAMEAIIAARDGIGGTAPSAVAREIERLGAELAALEAQEDK